MQKNVSAGVNLVTWSEAFHIGLPEIDDQHMMLVNLMNDLWAAIAANAPVSRCDEILARLENYTVAHFTAEEIMMRTLGYPELERHKAAHLEFVKRIQAERGRVAEGERPTLNILHFLQDWLIKHILVNDKAYADFYASRQQPRGLLGRFFAKFKGNDSALHH